MTNEELVVLIKQGDDGLLPQLWEQVRKFVAMMAKRHYKKFENKHGCELDDLVQAGYFGLIASIRYYKPEKELKFISYLNFTLKSAFNEALGIRSSKIYLLDYSDSLDRSINENGDISLLDTIGDLMPGEADLEELVVEDVWNQELRAALDEAMAVLSEKQHELLTMHYYFGLSLDKITEIRQCSRQNVCQQLNVALERIYYSKYRETLAEFLPYHDFEKNPYHHTGYGFWKDTGFTSQEAFLINYKRYK